MLHRVLKIALIAGVIAGLCVSILQMAQVVPLILEAEKYEREAENQSLAHEEWAPQDGWERTGYTVMTNILIGVGFGLLLCSAVVLRGKKINMKEGLFWGLGGFLAFSFFPSLGLPPELPGMSAADLPLRQIWWVITVALSAIGLCLIFFKQGLPWKGGGLILIAIPHLLGVPHPSEMTGGPPAELASQFVMASLFTSAVFWLIIGTASGWCFNRFKSEF